MPAVPAPGVTAPLRATAAQVRTCATCEGRKWAPVSYVHTSPDGHGWREPRTETCRPCKGTGERRQ